MPIRCVNVLKRTEIFTIGQLLSFPQQDFINLKNSGKKTVDDLAEVVRKLTSEDETLILSVINSDYGCDTNNDTNSDSKTFLNTDGEYYYDIPIPSLALSTRAHNCLTQQGILFASDFIRLTEADFYNFQSVGTKTVKEMLSLQESLTFSKVNSDILEENSENNLYCEDVVKKITKKLAIHPSDLLPQVNEIWDICVQSLLTSSGEVTKENTFAYKLYFLPLIREKIKETFCNIVKNNIYETTEDELFQCLPFCLSSEEEIYLVLNELVKERRLILASARTYEYPYPTLLTYANTIENEQTKVCLLLRLQGETLEAIGELYGLTRERVRQIIQKILKQAPTLKEDKYAELFTKYAINHDIFINNFCVNAATYHYLSYKYQKGHGSIEDLVLDSNFPSNFRRIAERTIQKEISKLYVRVDGELIKINKDEFINFILRKKCSSPTPYEEFFKYYNDFISKLPTHLDKSKFSLEGTGSQNKLTNSKFVLWVAGKMLRYYNIPATDFTEFLSTLNLLQYKDVEISTKKIYKDYAEIMDEYDILSEYELHNLLRKICNDDIYDNLDFSRTPHIRFGNVDRDKQVLDLLTIYSPIDNVSLANKYEEEYGVSAKTVLGNFFQFLDIYLSDGVYSLDTPSICDSMCEALNPVLSSDYYTFADFNKVCVDLFPDMDHSLLNTKTYKKLGYHVYSNYVISSKFQTANEYFKFLLTNPDILDIEDISPNITLNYMFINELIKHRSEYKLLQFSPNKYLNFRRLEKKGVTKDCIKNFCVDLYQYVTVPFFTISSLERSGFDHKFYDLGFEECFYSSVLMEDKVHFSSHRIGKNRLFSTTNAKVTFSDFLEFLIYSTETLYLDFYDLLFMLKDTYSLSVDRGKVTETLKETTLYYNKTTDKIYTDYDVYFDSI